MVEYHCSPDFLSRYLACLPERCSRCSGVLVDGQAAGGDALHKLCGDIGRALFRNAFQETLKAPANRASSSPIAFLISTSAAEISVSSSSFIRF